MQLIKPHATLEPVGGVTAPDNEETPAVIIVAGRSKDRENGDLLGEYRRIGMHHGRPAYRKPGTRTVVRYWSPADRWLIDRDGLQESDICNAYSEQSGGRHPALEDHVWRVWETRHRAHVRDPEFLVTAAPAAVQVVGRANGRENAAINGEYRLRGLHQGKVAYQRVGSKAAIRYWALGDRWLIDLDGLRDLDICNAFADARGSTHPGVPNLVWHVWDSSRGKHTVDTSLQAIHAPAVVEMLGRDETKENSSINGTYHLVGVHGGRPAYQKADGSGHAIRYWPREDRWLVDLDGLREVDVCNAYAEAQGAFDHPGEISLVWYIWETSRGRHLSDRAVHTMVVPHFIRVTGRDPQKENGSVNGEYELADIVGGRAGYRKADATHVLRYWPAEDRWIIDLESGFNGTDVANAYAEAKGAPHAGNPDLIWYVWETSHGRHIADEEVIAEPVWLNPDWTQLRVNPQGPESIPMLPPAEQREGKGSPLRPQQVRSEPRSASPITLYQGCAHHVGSEPMSMGPVMDYQGSNYRPYNRSVPPPFPGQM